MPRFIEVQPGVDIDVAVGGAAIAPGVAQQNGDRREPAQLWFFAEADLQLGTRRADNLGYAVQLKVPLLFALSSLDLYLELPSTSPWYDGLGVELGLLSSLYGVVTWMSPRGTYLTLTSRAVLLDGGENEGWGWMLNPQLSAGWAGRLADLSLFASFGHVLGRGIDYAWFCDEFCAPDYRKDFLLFGTSVRF